MADEQCVPQWQAGVSPDQENESIIEKDELGHWDWYRYTLDTMYTTETDEDLPHSTVLHRD